jgi:hypothetical protein
VADYLNIFRDIVRLTNGIGFPEIEEEVPILGDEKKGD